MTLDETPAGNGQTGSNPTGMSGKRSTSHEIERYTKLFAERTKHVRSSAMRDMMSITNRPEVISLAGGLPDTASFPPALLEEILVDIARTRSAATLQYGPTEGSDDIKRCIVEVMVAENMKPNIDDIIVTTGGQQVIDLVTRTLIDPGDTIIAEGPTYPGAVPSFSSFQANVVQIDLDSDGMKIDLLEETLDRLEAQGQRPKFIYTIPTFQNPGGVTMSLPRRKRLVEIARERELLVLEDNPYALLRYSGGPLPTLRSLDGGEYVMYLGTFSKILSPGLRLGWLVAPQAVLAKVNLAKQAADLCTSTLTQDLVVKYFEHADWREYIATVTETYRLRRDAMIAALERYFPSEATWTQPEGGLFIWASLPDFIDTTDLLAKALTANVAFVPGAGAFTDSRGHNSMRLNFSCVPEDKITEGIRRIGKVVSEQVSLYSTMTGKPVPQRSVPRGDAGAEGADVLRLSPRYRQAKRQAKGR